MAYLIAISINPPKVNMIRVRPTTHFVPSVGYSAVIVIVYYVTFVAASFVIAQLNVILQFYNQTKLKV